MPPPIDLELEGMVRALSMQGWSCRLIAIHLQKQGFTIKKSGVNKVINGKGKEREARRNGQEYKRKVKPSKTTNRVLTELNQQTSNPNPLSQEQMGNKVGLSQAHVSRVIKDKLGKKVRKKMVVHALTPEDKKNRKTNARKLYDRIPMDQLEFMVTLDESMMVLKKNNNQTKICYLKPGQQLPDNCLQENNECYPKKQMVVAGMTGRGTLPMLKIPGNAKCNAQNYVKYILKPYFEVHLPKLYPGEMNRILFHHDKASSHTAGLTMEYLRGLKAEVGINFLEKKDIPVKGPDISPLDFFGSGFVKQLEKSCRATTLPGLWKFWREHWSKVTPEKCTEVMRSWKRRLGYVYRRDGGHIEHVKKIHKRKLRI